jgi:charged multivesicular body protein 3
MSLFGKKPKPEEYVKKWKRELKREERDLERNIRSIEMEENKLKASIKQMAKKGDKSSMASAKTLALELVKSRKAKERLYKSKAQLNSVSMQLTTQLAQMKMAGIMAKSTQVMAAMNQLIRLPQLNKVMMAMSREMEKAGLIDEMIEGILDDDELEEEADEEVNKVLEEITIGIKTAPVVSDELPVKQQGKEEDVTDLEARLGKLKG